MRGTVVHAQGPRLTQDNAKSRNVQVLVLSTLFIELNRVTFWSPSAHLALSQITQNDLLQWIASGVSGRHGPPAARPADQATGPVPEK